MHMSQAWRQAAASTKIPLDVHIKVSTDVKFETPTLNFLRENVFRFQSLDIHVPSYETAKTLVSSIGEGKSAPLLERLNIHIEQVLSKNFRAFAALPTAFYPCPRLTHLTIPGMPPPVRSAPHFKSITSLTIDAIPFYDVSVDSIFDIIENIRASMFSIISELNPPLS
jgi:hypothetical protein